VSHVYDIAERYVEQFADLDPCGATGAGIPGHDRDLTDYSPAGTAARDDLACATSSKRRPRTTTTGSRPP